MPIAFGGIDGETDPDPIFYRIVGTVQQDIDDGNEDQIDHVGISAIGGLQLALEGVLTEQILREAKETPGSIIATIMILGKPRRIVIHSPDNEPVDEIATYDVNGEIV